MQRVRLASAAPPPMAIGFLAALATGGCSNLAWEEPKLYTPPSTEIFVEKLGIDGVVDVLPVGTSTVVVTHDIVNSGRRAVPAGYEISETVVRWVFRRDPFAVGWAAGDPATHTVVRLTQPGPALAPGERATITFGPIPVQSCGLYGETLELDAPDIVTESSESDNVDPHLFFVPSSQVINIALNTIDDTLVHDVGRTRTHDFVISSGAAGNQWLYAGFSFIATEGSTADAVPPPAPGVLFGPAPQTIGMFVTPRDHKIPALGFAPTVKGKITAISPDGCVIKQKVAEVLIEHE